MRLRYYLRGLGLGILFAVIIIAICGNEKGESLSDSQIMQRASELGMVSTENVKNHTLSNDTEDVKEENTQDTEKEPETQNSEAETKKDNTESTADNSSANNSETAGGQPVQNTDSQAQESASEAQNTADASAASQPAADSTPAEPQYVTITVTDGEVCRDIATDLQSKGLVDDAEKFRLYMGETGYASFIHNGDFQIPVGASYEEIANILLKK